MLTILSRLKVTDGTGVRVVQCIKILGGSLRRKAFIGDILVSVIKRVNAGNAKFKKGNIVRALVVRTVSNFLRSNGIWIRFGFSAVVLVNSKKAPISRRLKGPMLREVCIKYNFLGTVSRFII